LILRLQIEGCDLNLQRCGVRIAEGLLKDFWKIAEGLLPTNLLKAAKTCKACY